MKTIQVWVQMTVTAEEGAELNPIEVAKDVQLYLMDFPQAHANGETSNDVEGGWVPVRVESGGAW